MGRFVDPLNHYTLPEDKRSGLQAIYDSYQRLGETLDREIGPTVTDRARSVADGLADSRAAAVRCYLMTHGTAKPPSAGGF